MTTTGGMSPQVNVLKLLSDLKDCVQEISTEYATINANKDIPIDDTSTACHRFCSKLEQFLQLGFGGRNSLFGRKKSYWDFLKACLVSSQKGGVDKGIKIANDSHEVRCSSGRGRAFLRYCLSNNCLGDALQQSLMCTDMLNACYLPSAPMRDPVLAQDLVNLVYELNDIKFDLAPGGANPCSSHLATKER